MWFNEEKIIYGCTFAPTPTGGKQVNEWCRIAPSDSQN